MPRTTSQHSIPHSDKFFREPNIAVYARKIAPELAASVGGTLHVAIVGASAEETWTTASALSAAGIENYHIDALNNSPTPFENTRTFALRWGSLAISREQTPEYDPACLHFFEKITLPNGEEGIKPANDLYGRATFGLLDIMQQPLLGAYDTVITNNVIEHYLFSEIKVMVEHMLKGMHRGSILVTDESIPGYLREQHGLRPALKKPFARLGRVPVNHLLCYDPPAPKPPEPPAPPEKDSPPPIDNSGSLIQQVMAQLSAVRNKLLQEGSDNALVYLEIADDRLMKVRDMLEEALQGTVGQDLPDNIIGALRNAIYHLDTSFHATVGAEDGVERYRQGL